MAGLYPESHGIVGNQFYDGEIHSETRSSCKAFFNIDDERSTKHMKWWQKDDVEPIWATAAKHGVKFATFLWGRCDVPYDDVKRLMPHHCENYYSADLTKTLRINVDKALSQLQDGVDAAIVSDLCGGGARLQLASFSFMYIEDARTGDHFHFLYEV